MKNEDEAGALYCSNKGFCPVKDKRSLKPTVSQVDYSRGPQWLSVWQINDRMDRTMWRSKNGPSRRLQIEGLLQHAECRERFGSVRGQ